MTKKSSVVKVCPVCGRKFVPDKFHPYQKFCSKRCKWRWYSRTKARVRYHELRLKALEVLGGKCVICGINDPFLLTIDHIDGNWREDPVQRRDKRGLYRFIVNNPEEARRRYQVLCWNHNAMKYFYPEEFKRRYGRILRTLEKEGSERRARGGKSTGS